MKTVLSTRNCLITEPLTEREKEIMSLVATGKTNKEIATLLYISNETVKKHVQNIYQKLGVRNKIEALNRLLNSDQ